MASSGSPSRPDPSSAEVDRLFLPWKQDAPLAARMRPRALGEFVGQEEILGPGKLLRRAIEADRISSIILWGPPGSGKTTLARVMAGATETHFETLNAVLAGVKDIREVVARARARLSEPEEIFEKPRRTTLFVDEVHRFNKAQQDALLPHVENGTLIFIGATTENPYFEVIKALVSRSRIFELSPLGPDDLEKILQAALEDRARGYGGRDIRIDDEARQHLVRVSGGDARNLLNALELAVETTPADEEGVIHVDERVAEESIQRRALLYDKDGDAHYDTISAFIKSLRGSDVDAALYWLAKMVRAGEDPRFVARRLVIFASEDVGMADSRALTVATEAARAVEFVGLPECQWNLAHAVIYLATAPKSNSAIAYFDALRELESRGQDEVPDPLKDPSRDREGTGHGVGYKYPHAYREHWVPQQYLPDGLQGLQFYRPGELGEEAPVKERIERLRTEQEAGLSLERRLEDLGQGRERRRRAQREIHGHDRLRFRDRLLDLASPGPSDRVLDLGRPAGLLGWGALERVPLGKVWTLQADSLDAASLTESAKEEGVDRLLLPVVGETHDLPLEDHSVSLVVSSGLLYDHEDRAALVEEILRVLEAGGRWCGHEPFLGEGRTLSGSVDLAELDPELAEKIREAERAMVRDGHDRRLAFDEAALRELLEDKFESLDLERTLEPLTVEVTPRVLVGWFSAGTPERPSFEDGLARHLDADEIARYRQLVERQLEGQKIHRPRHGTFFTLGRSSS